MLKIVADFFKTLRQMIVGKATQKESSAGVDLKLSAGGLNMNSHSFDSNRFGGRSKTFKRNQRAERAKSAKREARRKGQV